MASINSISENAISSITPVAVENASLRTIASARTSKQIVFLEITARERDLVIAEDIVPGLPGSGIRGISGTPISALTYARGERQVVKFLFSTAPWTGAPADTIRPDQRARPRVITGGRISRSIPVEATTARRGQRTIGDARLANPDGALDFLLEDYLTKGQDIRAWLGDPQDDAGSWTLMYEASIEGIEATRHELRIGITTISDELSRPLQLRKYTGNGGLTGDLDVKGRLKPIGYGDIWGAAPVLISAADNIYQVHDSRINTIDWVREGGLDYTFTQDFGSFDALRSATLAAGEYATCLAHGLFRVGLNLAGLVYPLRVGFQGDATGNGYQASTGEILYRIARDRAFLGSSQLQLSSFQGLPAGSVGFYSDGSRSFTCEDVFNVLLNGVGGYFGVGRGKQLSVGRLIAPESRVEDLEVRAEQVFDTRVEDRPDVARSSQPFTYGPTADPVSASEVSPAADPDVIDRLTQDYFEDETTVDGEFTFPNIQSPTLHTQFSSRLAALAMAQAALGISSKSRLPMRADLGRLGVLVGMGSIISLPQSRYDPDFIGVVYDTDENLGATVTSKVLAIG